MLQRSDNLLMAGTALILLTLIVGSLMGSQTSAAPLLITATPTPTRTPTATPDPNDHQLDTAELAEPEPDVLYQFFIAFSASAAYAFSEVCCDFSAYNYLTSPHLIVEDSRLAAFERTIAVPLSLPLKACGYNATEPLQIRVVDRLGQTWLQFEAVPKPVYSLSQIEKDACYSADSQDNPTLPLDMPPGEYSLSISGQGSQLEHPFFLLPLKNPAIFQHKQQDHYVLAGFDPAETVRVITFQRDGDFQFPVGAGELTLDQAGQGKITGTGNTLNLIVIRDNYDIIRSFGGAWTGYTLSSPADHYDQALRQDPTNPELHFRRGQAEYAAEPRIRYFSRAIELRPDFTGAYLERARAYAEAGQPARQEADLLAALHLEPTNALVRQTLAQYYLGQQATYKAIEQLQQVVQLGDTPDQIFRAAEELARLYASENDTANAIAWLTWAIENRPLPSAALYATRANLYLQQDRQQQAIQDFERAVEVDHEDSLRDPDFYTELLELQPDHALSHYRRGLIIAAVRQSPEYETAIDAFTQALHNDPNLIGAYFQRGLVQSTLENFPAALDDFNAFITQLPDYLPAYYQRATMYEQWAATDPAKYDLALADYDLLIERHPNQQHYLARAKLLDRMGRSEEALADYKAAIEDGAPYYDLNIEVLERIIQSFPQFAPAYYLRAKTLTWKDPGQAIADHEAAIKHDPSLAEAYLAVAELYDREGETDLAANSYLQALNLIPADTFLPDNYREIHLYLIDYFEQRAQFDHAVDIAGRWLELRPDDTDVLETRALFQATLGNLAGALADADRLVKVSGSPQAYFRRGELNDRTGNQAQARADFLAALARMKMILNYPYLYGYLELESLNLERAVELLPANAETYYWRAVKLRRTDPQQAISDLEQVLQYTNDPILLENTSQALEQLRR